MICEVCGMSIPEAFTECVNCALPKKDQVKSMKLGWKQPKPRKTKKKTSENKDP